MEGVCGMSQECFRKTALFSGSDPLFLEQLMKYLSIEMFPAASNILTEGETGDKMYFLYRGSVEVLVGPEEQRVVTLPGGSVFGEMALFGMPKRTATIRALEFCDCRVITHHLFNMVLQKFPKEQITFAGIAKERLAALEKNKAEDKRCEAENDRRSTRKGAQSLRRNATSSDLDCVNPNKIEGATSGRRPSSACRKTSRLTVTRNLGESLIGERTKSPCGSRSRSVVTASPRFRRRSSGDDDSDEDEPPSAAPGGRIRARPADAAAGELLQDTDVNPAVEILYAPCVAGNTGDEHADSASKLSFTTRSVVAEEASSGALDDVQKICIQGATSSSGTALAPAVQRGGSTSSSSGEPRSRHRSARQELTPAQDRSRFCSNDSAISVCSTLEVDQTIHEEDENHDRASTEIVERSPKSSRPGTTRGRGNAYNQKLPPIASTASSSLIFMDRPSWGTFQDPSDGLGSRITWNSTQSEPVADAGAMDDVIQVHAPPHGLLQKLKDGNAALRAEVQSLRKNVITSASTSHPPWSVRGKYDGKPHTCSRGLRGQRFARRGNRACQNLSVL